MKIQLYLMIPSIFLLTCLYFGLGKIGHWNYSETDFVVGNILNIGLVGLVYGGEVVYNKFKK